MANFEALTIQSGVVKKQQAADVLLVGAGILSASGQGLSLNSDTGSISVQDEIAMNSNKVSGLAAASANNDALAYGQSAANLAGLTIDTAALVMSTQKITGLGAGTLDNDAIAFGQSGVVLGDLTLDTGTLAMGAQKITGLADGTVATDAVTKGQLDSLAAGFDRKQSVRVATTAALPANTQAGTGAGATLTADAVGILTVDGIATVLGDRILVKNESPADDNGIYEVTTEGTAGVAYILTRATDADIDAEVSAGMFTFVEAGTSLGDTGWFLITNDPIVVDTTGLVFSQFAGVGTFTGGNGIDVNAGVISADLEAAGAGTGGLSFDAGEIRVLAGQGIALSAGGVDVDLEASGAGTGGLSFDASQLRVSAGDGVELTAGGVAVDLAADKGLEFATGELQVKAYGAGGIEVDANGVGINLEASNPSLQVSATEIGIKFNADGGLQKLAAGTGLKLNGTTLALATAGVSVLGLPSLFTVNGSAVGAAVSAANLDTLTDGSNADALHTHASAAATEVTINGTADAVLLAGELVTFDDAGGNGNVAKADANGAGILVNAAGFADAGASAAAAVSIQVSGEVTIADALWTDGTKPTAADIGKRVYMSEAAGQVTYTPVITAGSTSLKVGLISFADGSADTTRVAVSLGEPFIN